MLFDCRRIQTLFLVISVLSQNLKLIRLV